MNFQFLCLIISNIIVANCFVPLVSKNRPMHRPLVTPATTTTSIQMNTATATTEAATCGGSAQQISTKRRKLPTGKLIVGYANWNQCDEKIVEAVQHGVNVVIWFSINLLVDEHGQPAVGNGPDMACVASKVKRIRDLGLECVHLISIGGWNSPHPDTTHSAEVVFQHWHEWNTVTIADPTQGFYGFDGFDW
jgi:hypothetical protein